MQILPQLALECTKLMKVGIFFELDIFRFVPSGFWYNRRPGYLFMPVLVRGFALLALAHEMFN